MHFLERKIFTDVDRELLIRQVRVRVHKSQCQGQLWLRRILQHLNPHCLLSGFTLSPAENRLAAGTVNQ